MLGPRLTLIPRTLALTGLRTSSSTFPFPTISSFQSIHSGTGAGQSQTRHQQHHHDHNRSHSKQQRKWTVPKILGYGLLLTIGGGFSIAYYNDPFFFVRIERSSTFWAEMFPIYLRYKYEKWLLRNEPADVRDKRWQMLHEHYAPQVLNLLLRLHGIYIKIGQVIASRDDIAPEIYRNTFKSLFDSVPGLPGPQAVAIVEKALGKKIDQVFSFFDDVPIGAASIGQVHKAILKNGRHVVVKIQYPDAHATFKLDITTLRLFGSLAQPEQVPIFDEMERQILAEFDFGREAWALSTVYHNVKKQFPQVIIPRPIPGLHNDQIIVMEYIPGVKLIDVIVHDYKRMASKFGISLEDLKRGFDHLPWTTKVYRHCRYGVLTAGELLWRSVATTYNYTLGLVLPNLDYGYIRPDYKQLFEILLEVHGREILIDGIFNGDPHPGNVLVTPDGRLGLIDYGQVKSLTRRDRRQLARLLLSLAKGESAKSETLQLVKDAGFETKRGDDFVLYKTTVLGLDRDDLEVTEGMGFQFYLEYLRDIDETKKVPEDYVLVVRTCILLRGLGSLLGLPPTSIAQKWRHIAEEALLLFPEDEAKDKLINIYPGAMAV